MSTSYLDSLLQIREAIESIDEQIVTLCSIRNEYVQKIGMIKKENNLEVYQPEQAAKKQAWFMKKGGQLQIRRSFMRKLWRLIHHESLYIQKKILGEVYVLQQIEAKKQKLQARIQKRTQKKLN